MLGWDVDLGRVLSFSTFLHFLGATELANPDYRRLFANAVSWAAETPCREEVPTLLELFGFIDCFRGPAAGLGPMCSGLDMNCDGHIDLRDVAILQRILPTR